MKGEEFRILYVMQVTQNEAKEGGGEEGIGIQDIFILCLFLFWGKRVEERKREREREGERERERDRDVN